jgi:hypothetical protein
LRSLLLTLEYQTPILTFIDYEQSAHNLCAWDNTPYSHRRHVESGTRLKVRRLFTLTGLHVRYRRKTAHKQIKTRTDFFVAAMSTGDK